MATIYALTKELFNKIHTMWRWQRNIRITGDGVTSNNNENGLTVSIKAPRQNTLGVSGQSIYTVIPYSLASGRGKYIGKIQIPLDALIEDTTNLDTVTPFGTELTDDVLILNSYEFILASAVPLQLNRPYNARLLQNNPDPDNRKVFIVDGISFGCGY